MSTQTQLPIILASRSPYRKELLQRLQLPFTIRSPDSEESPRSGESPEELASRLACDKAKAVHRTHPQCLVIGSDQVCAHEGIILGKPGSHARAAQQLQIFSGQCIKLHSAVSVIRGEQQHSALVTGTVYFKTLTDKAIENYLRKEQPYDCAGACKLEGLGITLIQRIECSDPTALMGMPMIKLSEMLVHVGISLP